MKTKVQRTIFVLLMNILIVLGQQEIEIDGGMPITGKTRPPQDCPINNDLQYRRCLSPCQPRTCGDLRREPPNGRPCVRMCVSGWACPPGQYLLDGYADVCLKKKACKKLKKKRVTDCTFEGTIIPLDTNFLRGSDTCRCFIDGQVRCRNAFPEENNN
ncbi:uncharacterized protein LOC129281253 [Lytechinus pictus]|uniref:uncharacterized protein LOC129281253 n=1 Tax=Lytechinus pictus TaxID=7653 RepID=UPI0030B9D53E